MDSTKQETEQQFARLQQKVGDCHTEVAKLTTGDDRFEAAYDRLVTAAAELVEFEKTVPGRLAEPARKASARIVAFSWGGQAALGAALIALIVVWDRSLWWLVLLVPHVLATAAGAFQKVDTEGHRHRRNVALWLHVLGALVALVSLHLISAWFLIAILLGWTIVGGALLEDPDTKKEAAKA